MSELKIAEFRERAQDGVDLPDLAVIERRGHGLRRRRIAAAAGGLALVLAAGAGVATTASNGDDASGDPAAPPSPTPSDSSWDDGVRTTPDAGEEVLSVGPSEVVYDDVMVRFDVPGEGWEWWETGMGLRRSGDPDAYAATVFFLQEPVARLRPCSADRAEPLGNDPDDLIRNVAPVLNLAHATVLQQPRVVTAFGTTAVHVRLRTNGSCFDAGDVPGQLRGEPHGAGLEPGWPGQHVLDLWHVVGPGRVPGSMLVASWDLWGTGQDRAEQNALLDSIRFDSD